MADWYVSSAAYALVAQWAAGHTYAVGNIVTQLAAPGQGNERCFRADSITTGVSGATEPGWDLYHNHTTVDGGVTWREVTGVSTYNWSAPANVLQNITNNLGLTGGDRVFFSSDHSETWTGGVTFQGRSTSPGAENTFISVNRGSGHIPPLTADITTGASVTTSSGQDLTIQNTCGMMQGFTFNFGRNLNFGSNTASQPLKLKDCLLSGSGLIQSADKYWRGLWDNVKIQATGTGLTIFNSQNGAISLDWVNTPSAIQGATIPTNLFSQSNGSEQTINVRGVDLSALITGNSLVAINSNQGYYLFEGCKLSSTVTVVNGSFGYNNAYPIIELVNCNSSGTHRDERHDRAGDLTTDTGTTLSGGANDGVAGFAHKLVSGTNNGVYGGPFESFPLVTFNSVSGSSKTATVEIISSGTLNTNDISLEVEYPNDASSPLTALASSLPGPLDTATSVTSSSATWNSPPGTPVTQKLQVSFTPQRAGPIRGIVKLHKQSTSVWINPQMTIA